MMGGCGIASSSASSSAAARAMHVKASEQHQHQMMINRTIQQRRLSSSVRARTRRANTATMKDDDGYAASSSSSPSSSQTDRRPNGGGARSFVGASFYDDPYDSRGGGSRGLPSARQLATNVRNLSGPMSGAARRAKSAMRPTNGGGVATPNGGGNGRRNRADEVIERRRKIERDMRSQMVDAEVQNLVKERARKALECERVDLNDGSVLFKFKTDKVAATISPAEEQKLAQEVEKRLWGDTKTNDNVIARWFMTVRFLASTLSVENALVYVATTPLRVAFWSVAYVLRAIFWIITGRGGVRAPRRAKNQLKQINTVVTTGPDRGFNPFGSVNPRRNWRAE